MKRGLPGVDRICRESDEEFPIEEGEKGAENPAGSSFHSDNQLEGLKLKEKNWQSVLPAPREGQHRLSYSTTIGGVFTLTPIYASRDFSLLGKFRTGN